MRYKARGSGASLAVHLPGLRLFYFATSPVSAPFAFATPAIHSDPLGPYGDPPGLAWPDGAASSSVPSGPGAVSIIITGGMRVSHAPRLYGVARNLPQQLSLFAGDTWCSSPRITSSWQSPPFQDRLRLRSHTRGSSSRIAAGSQLDRSQLFHTPT